MHTVSALAVAALAAVAVLGSAASAQELDFEGSPFTIPYDGPAEGTAPALCAR